MNTTTLCHWAMTMGLLGVTLIGGETAGAATVGHKAESGGLQAGRPPETSKAAPKGQDKADAQPDSETRAFTPPDPTPANKTQIMEERLRRGDMDEANVQGQISNRLDQFYQGSERLPGRQASGSSDR